MRTALASARARVQHPAEGCVRLVVDGLVVDVHQAGRDPCRDVEAARHIRGEDAQRQPVGGVVREPDRVLDGVEPDDWRHRTEDLFGVCRAGHRHVGQHRRAVEQLVVRPAGGETGAGVNASHDHCVNLVALACVDDRTQGHLSGGRVSHGQMVGASRQRLDVRVSHSALDEVPAGRHTDLSLVGERPPGSDRRSGIDVDVVQDHEHGVAAQLQVDPLQMLRGQRAHSPAGPRRPGERDHSHRPLHDQGLTDVRPAGQDVQQPVRKSSLGKDLREHRTTADGRPGIRLQQDRVAQRQGRGHGADRQDRRHVEGGNHPDDPDRHPAGHAQPWL